MIIRQFCPACDDDTRHLVEQLGPFASDAEYYCLACHARDGEPDDHMLGGTPDDAA